MPLSKIQTDILRLLATHRDPQSYIAGSTPLTRKTSRYSSDIDVFHDREGRVGQAATEDSTLLQRHGYMVKWTRPGPGVQPDPDHLEEYQGHAGRYRGHWPGSPEIAAAMFENYHKKPDATKPNLTREQRSLPPTNRPVQKKPPSPPCPPVRALHALFAGR